jgi:hypothetical protein
MGGRVTIGMNRILRRRNHVAVEHKHCTERMITSGASLTRQLDGLPGKPLVNVDVVRHG